MLRLLSASALVVCLAPSLCAAEQDALLAEDEKTLRNAGIATDGPALLAYLRAQTPTDADRARLARLVPQLGSRLYSQREKATRDLIAAGRSALPYLRTGLESRDLEMRRRCERAIEDIERVPYLSVMTALTRVLAARKAPGTVEALLAYAPTAEEDEVLDALFEALPAVAITDGKPVAAALAAVADREPMRRAAAAFVLGQAVPPAVKSITPLLQDSNAEVRYRAAEALVRSRDRAGVSALVPLAGESGRVGWRAEELLYRIAGDNAPAAPTTAGAAGRRQAQETWQTWWKTHGEKIDLARVDFANSLIGLTLYCEYDSGNGDGRIWLSGPDAKKRWEITGVGGPNDVQLLPGGRVLVAERNSSRVTERDTSGRIVWEKRMEDSAIAAQRLPGGNTLVTGWNKLSLVAPDGGIVWAYAHNSGFRQASRLRNGRIVAVTSSGQVLELDSAGKLLRTITPAQYTAGAGYWASVEQLMNGHYLVALGSAHRVVEIEESGRIVWEATVSNAVFATRLRNGNTLVCNFEEKAVIEVDRAGKEVGRQALAGRPFAVRKY